MRHVLRSSMLVAAVVVALLLSAQAALAAATADVVGADRIDRSTVQATVSVTCDPLVGDSVAALALTIFQGKANTPNYREGQGGVGLEGVNGLVCDGTSHTYSFPVRLTSFFTDARFTPGPAGAEWFVQVCTKVDPDTTVCSGAGGPTQERIRIAP
jgi:hypothetical protein